MRNFDLHNRWLDKNGNILRGCVEVMVRDGNTKAPIYDSDGVAISNPQLTDIYGRTDQQIFINTDVVAYFYKYIGDGRFEDIEADGIDTSDQTKWDLQYTAENQLKIGLTFTTDSPICVGSRADLDDIDPEQVPTVGGVKMVEVLGYNEPGDTQPVRYIWNEETDAWDMVPPAVHLDVRLFGVFPSSSQNDVENQRAGIMAAVQYANENGLRVWFPKTETNTGNNIEYKYYRYDNLYAVFGNGLDVDEGVIFLDSGTNSTFRFSDIRGDLYFQSAKTAVLANYAKASWNMRSLAKNNDLDPATYVIDTMELSTGVRSLTKWTVKCTTDLVYGFTFSYCDIGEDGALGSVEIDGTWYNNEFWNCRLTGKMFITTGQYEASLVNLAHNCEFDIQDFRHCPQLWRELRCTDDANPFIDWQDLQAPGKPYASYVGNKILSTNIMVSNLKNGLEDKITIDAIGNQTALVLDDVTGWYKISAALTTRITNSVVKLSLQNGNNIEIENSVVYLDTPTSLPVPPTVTFKNCTVFGDGESSYKFETLTSYSSILNLDMRNRFCVVKDSQINGELRLIPRYVEVGKTVTYEGNQTFVQYLISAYIDNNIFNGSLIIDGYAGYEEFNADHVLVDNLIIENNRSNISDFPWVVTTRGAMDSDILNSYSWRNNSGGFENFITVEATCRLSTGDYNAEGKPGVIAMTGNAGLTIISAWSAATNVDETDYNKYFAVCRLFTIGTKDVVINAEVLLTPRGEQGGSNNSRFINYGIPSVIPVRWDDVRYSQAAQTILPDLTKVRGDSTGLWRIRNFFVAETTIIDPGSQFYVTIRQRDK